MAVQTAVEPNIDIFFNVLYQSYKIQYRVNTSAYDKNNMHVYYHDISYYHISTLLMDR